MQFLNMTKRVFLGLVKTSVSPIELVHDLPNHDNEAQVVTCVNHVTVSTSILTTTSGYTNIQSIYT